MSRSPGEDGPGKQSATHPGHDEFPSGSHRRPHMLITGMPGVGKQTLIRELAKRLAALRPVGFYTEEMRDAQGAREGFRLVTFRGRSLVLAHLARPGPSRVGRYGVDVAGFEQVLAELDLGQIESRLVIIDEIGKMECLSPRFIETVTRLLNGSSPVIATVSLNGEGFSRAVKQRPDCRLVTVTRDNRDRLLEALSGEWQH